MKELVEVLAQALVDHPEEVVVTETETENEILLDLRLLLMTWVRLLESRAVLPRQSVLL